MTVISLSPSFVIPSPLHITRTHLRLGPPSRSPFQAPTIKSLPPRRRTTTSSLTPTQQTALTALAVPALPIVAYSEYILGTTGCGLPPGPYGLLGAMEGVSYLVLAGIVAVSVYVKATTGKGLPPGPANLLGAAEGISYLLLLLGLADAAYVFKIYGSLPSAVPVEGGRCFAP